MSAKGKDVPLNPRAWTSWDEVPLQLTTGQVCELLGVSKSTLRKWHRIGMLTPRALPGVRAIRYPREEVRAFAGENGVDPF